MNPAHPHNLTDAEFVRQFDNTDDPVLKEALRRIEEAASSIDARIVEGNITVRGSSIIEGPSD